MIHIAHYIEASLLTNLLAAIQRSDELGLTHVLLSILVVKSARGVELAILRLARPEHLVQRTVAGPDFSEVLLFVDRGPAGLSCVGRAN